jgi:hypothetical protein
LVVARSVLPYSLELVLHAVRRDPTHLETTLTGDLEGVVRWHLTDLGPSEIGLQTRMDFEQEVQVTGRLLRMASRAARPLMVWNHERMMRGCLAGLNARLGQMGNARSGG